MTTTRLGCARWTRTTRRFEPPCKASRSGGEKSGTGQSKRTSNPGYVRLEARLTLIEEELERRTGRPVPPRPRIPPVWFDALQDIEVRVMRAESELRLLEHLFP